MNGRRNKMEIGEYASSSDTASEYESDNSTSFSDIGACGVHSATPINKKPVVQTIKVPRNTGELKLDQLPPIEELQISVPEEQYIKIGVVITIFDQLVIVRSNRGTPKCDIDTLFFLNRGKLPFGRVFDVLGNVNKPFYAVRFNSYKQAKETGVKLGSPLYIAPTTKHTAYVSASKLMKLKRSDASWEDNKKPPEACLDYSDDEEERQAHRLFHSKRPITAEKNRSHSLERNKRFKEQSNERNEENKVYKNQKTITADNSKNNPDIRPSMMGASLGSPKPHPRVLQNPVAPLLRPNLSAPPYQFAATPRHGSLAKIQQLDFTGARQHLVPPMLALPPSTTVIVPPFNLNISSTQIRSFNHNFPPPMLQSFNLKIPPPMMRPQPVPYLQIPRHPSWLPPSINLEDSVIQQPGENFGNGSSYKE